MTFQLISKVDLVLNYLSCTFQWLLMQVTVSLLSLIVEMEGALVQGALSGSHIRLTILLLPLAGS